MKSLFDSIIAPRAWAAVYFVADEVGVLDFGNSRKPGPEGRLDQADEFSGL
jgi:hypothetical protein